MGIAECCKSGHLPDPHPIQSRFTAYYQKGFIATHGATLGQ